MQLVHFEQAPPRSWDQFEELCADVFQDEWSDTGLVRHGRAGQPQNGVDIIGRDGAFWPVGIQCKKKSAWPVQSLSTRDLDAEVKKAKRFKPALKAFYLVSTAPDDEKLQARAREITAEHQSSGLFTVGVIGWGELVRRAVRHPHVAAKHFGPYSAGQPSPLLASWRAEAAKLTLDEAELTVAIREILYDFRDYPAGRLTFRTKETDDIRFDIRHLQSAGVSSLAQRKAVLKLREKLYVGTYDEECVVMGLKLLLSHPELSESLRIVWDKDAPLLVRSFIEQQIDPKLADIKGKEKIRLHAPRELADPAGNNIAVFMPIPDHSLALKFSWELKSKYPDLNVQMLSELFKPVRFGYAIPAILRRMITGLRAGIPLEVFEQARWLDFDTWEVSF